MLLSYRKNTHACVMYRICCVNGNNKTGAMLLTYSACLALFPLKGWTDTHLLTCSYTCNNSAGITDVDRDTCTHTQLLFISSSTSLWYSLTLAQVLPDEFTSLSPPVSEACADCPTAGMPGSLYHLLCPALCPLQLAVLAFCSPRCRLCTQAAGVPAKSVPSSLQPTLPLTSLE